MFLITKHIVEMHPFLVNSYVSVIEELCNCLSLSFRFNEHFNFSLDDIF